MALAMRGFEALGAGRALGKVLAAGIVGCTRADDSPEGLLIRHNSDGPRPSVKINLDGPDTIIRAF